MAAWIGATHVLCSIGSGAGQAWASARAGIARIGDSHVMDRQFEPIQMGLVPEDALAALPAKIDEMPLPARARRLLRLAAPSLRAVTPESAGEPIPLFIGLPELSAAEAPWLAHVPAYLQIMTGASLDRARSVVVPRGRASALLALEQALALLATGSAPAVIVGGVDTYLDLRLLGTLDAERRILGRTVMDGFIPGEGAAFFVLSGARPGRRVPSQPGAPDTSAGTPSPPVLVHAAASVLDPGHRYGDAPARGEGLALALAEARARLPQALPPVATTFAGFNGESFDAKLWGVAHLRHHDFFTPDMAMEHPADKFGDAGAAMGAILMVLAAQALATGTRKGPALVWAASDREPRGCALVGV